MCASTCSNFLSGSSPFTNRTSSAASAFSGTMFCVCSPTQNIVPEKAEAALDVRLVKGEDPDKKFEQVLAHIRKQGFYVTSAAPTKEERLSNSGVVRVVKDVWNYRASRTSMEWAVSKALVQLVQDTTGGSAVI